MAQQGNKQEVFWIGRSDIDPYWARCAGEVPVREFETVFDAVAEVLTGGNARILVMNAIIIGPHLKAEVKTLLASGLFDAIYLYTPLPRIPQYTPNGDARIVWVDRPEQLMERLLGYRPTAPVEAVQAKEPAETPVSVFAPEPEPAAVPARPEPIWPLQPPVGVVERKPEAVQVKEAAGEAAKIEEKDGIPVPSARAVAETPAEGEKKEEKAFCAAELTSEELQALLGADNKTEKEA